MKDLIYNLIYNLQRFALLQLPVWQCTIANSQKYFNSLMKTKKLIEPHERFDLTTFSLQDIQVYSKHNYKVLRCKA
jgi:hypothetical protein